MLKLKQLDFTTVFISICSLSISAQENLTANTRRLEKGKTSPAAKLTNIKWLAGSWTGEAFGSIFDEIWSPANDGAMMGMFRLVRQGKPLFYEIIIIAEENDSLVMRLKHFHSDLKGWEEKDKTIDFPLVSKTENALYFEGLTIQLENPNNLTVYLAINQKDGKISEEKLDYKRVLR